MYGVVDRVDVVCYADKPVSVLGFSLASTSNSFFIRNRESALHFIGLVFKGITCSGFRAVLMVRSDFSMDIPIKTTLNLQLHYTRISHLKWPSLKGTNTNYLNKSQIGWKDIE